MEEKKIKIENLEGEKWQDIPSFEGRYQASTKGRIKSLIGNEEKLVSSFKERNQYKRVALTQRFGEGSQMIKQRLFSVHRLIAMTFIPNPNPAIFTEINHKDGNKDNNEPTNLEWTTRSENMLHAFRTGLVKNNRGPRDYLFTQYDLQGNIIHKWNSISDCAYVLSQQGLGEAKVIASNINACLNRNVKTCCGYTFSYKDNVAKEETVERIQNAAKMPVLAYPLSGNKGAYSICGEPIRFRGINDTQGYVMPNGKVACASLVSKCCKGKRDSHIGYKWAYEENVKEGLDVSETLAVKRPIEQIDPITGEVIKTWTCGVMGIAKELGFATYTGISMCLSGKLKNSNGFVWRYKE